MPMLQAGSASPASRCCACALQAAASPDEDDECALLLKDLTTLAAIAWRARRRVHAGGGLTADHLKASRAAVDAFAALDAALKETRAGPDDSIKHPDVSAIRAWCSCSSIRASHDSTARCS
jgi:hypothetical protein